jgi:hypothetical protein
MANRSDFFDTSAKQPRLPRYLKKALSLQGGTPEIRRMFVQAHLVHVAYKLKRGNDADAVDTTEAA